MKRKPTLLIIGRENDPHIIDVLENIVNKEISIYRFDPGEFPSKYTFSLKLNNIGKYTANLSSKKYSLDLNNVDLVWNRVRSRSKAYEDINPTQKLWTEENCTRFLAYIYELILCPWIPYRPNSFVPQFCREAALINTVLQGQRFAEGDVKPSPENKLYQLIVAASLGFTIPNTLITNNVHSFLEFYSKMKGNLISKKFVDLNIRSDNEPLLPYTHKITRNDLLRVHSIRHAPVLFQENVDKLLELRITVVGDNVFAAEIFNTKDIKQSIDWRHYPIYNLEKFYSTHTLPEKVKYLCIELVKKLGLCFGAIDMILHPQKGYIFLEINPNGQWGWIEELTDMQITKSFSELLINKTYMSYKANVSKKQCQI